MKPRLLAFFIFALWLVSLPAGARVPPLAGEPAAQAAQSAAAAPAAADSSRPATAPQPRLVFIKEFPRSSPAYYSIAVSRDGSASFMTAPDDAQPVQFRLPDPLVRQLFDAFARLDNLRGVKLDTPRKVAFMGKKTLVYEAGGQKNEASFNYSENAEANALASAFEKIANTQEHLLDLDRVVHYDKLGVYQVILQIQMAINKRDLVEPKQLAPLLEKVAGDSRFMNPARERAREILNAIDHGYTPDVNLNPHK